MKASHMLALSFAGMVAGCDVPPPQAPVDDVRREPVENLQLAARSTDYPGPCRNEVQVAGSPAYLSVDINTKPADARDFVLSEPGRFRMGISCNNSLVQINRDDGQLVFTHSCTKHGFGWYDATQLPAGRYHISAAARAFPFRGHMTVDTYVFQGNGGVYQPVNCSR